MLGEQHKTKTVQRVYGGSMMLRSVFEKIVVLSLCAQVALCSVARPRCPEEPVACAAGAQLVPKMCACCSMCARQRAHERDSCILNGAVYRDGEAFFPSCSYQCVCKGGQIGCVPRCHLDVMLPGPDCPYPRKVQIPGECCEKWVCEPQPEATALGGLAMAAYRQEETVGFDQWDPSVNCIEQTTEWSACSRTCGMGVSSRVTNKNQRCEMVKQSRLCMVRPCDGLKEHRTTQQERKCLQTKKSTKAVYFTFKNCTSIQAFRPRFCGLCTDGRCCTPHSTKTAQVEFQCLEGKVIKRPVMFINTCACHHHCPRENAGHQPSADTGYDGLQL